MAKVDQALRECLVEVMIHDRDNVNFLCSMINLKRESFSPGEDGIIEEFDRKHYAQLKQILEGLDEGWPVISKYGKEADFHAWLICQHASFDREWQKQTLLPRLKKLLEKGEINRAGYAWLSDPSEENLSGMEEMLRKEEFPWNSMVASIHKMRLFFQVIKSISLCRNDAKS